MSDKKEIPVVVTTLHKGVFFGYIDDEESANDNPIVIKRAMMCVYWSSGVKGILGLPTDGPDKDSRISGERATVRLHNVTAVAIATKKAAKNWEKKPWG